MNCIRKYLIEKRQAAREGKRFAAFYRGARACRAGRQGNPYTPGSDEARCWEAGWKYAESEATEQLRADPPLCRFGPGGDFTRDWPEEKQ